ncbi:MAG: hypothetical protein Q9218_002404 [Villophora microphyllina]
MPNTMFDSLPVSGIHRLFTSASSQSPQSYKPPLESVTEESHTYDLLYPDFHALQQSQDQAYPFRTGTLSPTAFAASSFDDRGGLDIQSPRDVRILVAQDGISSHQAKVLYDSHPRPIFPASRLSLTESKGELTGWVQQPDGLSGKTQTFPQAPTESNPTRNVSLNHAPYTTPIGQRSPLSPATESRGLFGISRPRRTMTRPATSEGETHYNKIVKEGKEEVEALLGCMFGSTGLPLMSGTKMHLRPSATAEVMASSQCDTGLASPELESSQITRRRRTPLTRSTTADEAHFLSASAPGERPDPSQLPAKGSAVLITRLFTVDPPGDLSPRPCPEEGHVFLDQSGVQSQVSRSPRRPSAVSDAVGAKQTKCPTYALSLMLRLSPITARERTSTSQMTTPGSPSASEPTRFTGDGQWREAKLSDGACNDTDHDVEQIINRWNVLNRQLCSLERVVREKIEGLLTEIDLASPPHMAAPPSGPANKNPSDSTASHVKKSKQSYQRIVQLPADALQHNDVIRKAATVLGQRVALVLRTRRVITGQGRWGVWREEARWVGRWAGNREQNFFFFNLLSVFLGAHTEWLDCLDGLRTNRLRTKCGKGRRPDCTSQQQTVIVSTDKMAARRLIFLLSAFLRSAAPQDSSQAPQSMRTKTSFSQSPPSGVPLLREQSLRRTINQRQRGNRRSQGSRVMHGRSLSFADHEHDDDRVDEQISQSSGTRHARRVSNAASIRSLAPPISNNGDSTRKSSTTTTSTVVPDATIPVAHFSNVSRDPLMGTTPTPRPGSSGSLASLSLQRTLSRSQSNEHSNASTGSRSFGRWGSMVSGFWGSRRGSATEESEAMSSPTEGLGISGVSKMPGQTSSGSIGALAKMVEETESLSLADHLDSAIQQSPPGFPSPDTLREPSNEAPETPAEAGATQARPIPERPPVESFPVKLSVGDGEGVIDVQLPSSGSYSSSFGSSIGSAGQSHTAASSFNERSSVFTRSPSKDGSHTPFGSPPNVAGWLKGYSPDFALQAVRPYQGMKDDIKKAMEAGSTPQDSSRRKVVDGNRNEGWRDVRTSLVADTTNFSITKLSFQRRALPKKTSSTNLSSPFTSTGAEQNSEERIIEESIMDIDPTLIDAVERILAQSGYPSRVQSRAPSRAPSHINLRDMSADEANHDYDPALEVPKSECKRLVLGALEQVVRSVQAEQEAGGGARRIGGEPVRKDEEGEFPPDSTLREGVRRWLRGVGAVP